MDWIAYVGGKNKQQRDKGHLYWWFWETLQGNTVFFQKSDTGTLANKPEGCM